MEEINFTPKSAKFLCNNCDFECYKKSDWQRHVKTIKHLYRHNGNNMETAEIQKNAEHICNCGKKFLTNSGLWKHTKICKTILNNEKEDTHLADKTQICTNNKDELIAYLMNETKELKTLILDIAKKDTYTINNTHTNSHNKSFNLNFFLNETCKDAMNITDFVDSIKLQLSDLEGVGELGYVEGISNIIVKNLKQLDVTQRPVHCTDKKRETIYIKDEDKWEKDDEKEKMHKIVRKIADKNARMLPKFKEAHPDCNKAASKYSDAYNKIIVESMGGSGDNNFEKEEKIIKKVSKEVMIEK